MSTALAKSGVVAATDLLAQLAVARARLEATLDLLDRALDLREWLWFGTLDMDHARDLVGMLKRDVQVHRRSR